VRDPTYWHLFETFLDRLLLTRVECKLRDCDPGSSSFFRSFERYDKSVLFHAEFNDASLLFEDTPPWVESHHLQDAVPPGERLVPYHGHNNGGTKGKKRGRRRRRKIKE
jgi:hypothetical protein